MASFGRSAGTIFKNAFRYYSGRREDLESIPSRSFVPGRQGLWIPSSRASLAPRN